ncbi:MAG: hypothetical protein NUW37_20275 [Planctomycetes bacterium]|nr:hypothetical protein [Planctomycetota bacterium]
MREYVSRLFDDEDVTSFFEFEGATRANTDNGALYASVAYAGGTATIDVYNHPDRTAASKVCAGSTATIPGTVTLAESNASGITGTVKVNKAQSAEYVELGALYADDGDLAVFEHDLSGLLDESGQLAGMDGFEGFLREAKREIDSIVEIRLRTSEAGWVGWRAPKFRVTSDVSRAAVAEALALVFWHVRRGFDDPVAKTAISYKQKARQILSSAAIEVKGPLGETVTLSPLASTVHRR